MGTRVTSGTLEWAGLVCFLGLCPPETGLEFEERGLGAWEGVNFAGAHWWAAVVQRLRRRMAYRVGSWLGPAHQAKGTRVHLQGVQAELQAQWVLREVHAVGVRRVLGRRLHTTESTQHTSGSAEAGTV